jgi:hypothetical protein
MKKTTLFFLLLFLASSVFAGQAVVLPELNNPFLMEVEGSKMYITEGPHIYIYSLTDFKLIKKFGKQGEGPKEFRVNPFRNAGSVWIYLQPDHILVNSIGKVSYFSKDGKYISEKVAPNGVFQPMVNKKQFIAYGYIQDENEKANYVTVNIYDENFKKGKELYRQQQPFQTGREINPFDMIGPLNYAYQDKIFIKGQKGIIHVFDQKGEKLMAVTHDYEKLNVISKDKEGILNWYKTNPMTKQLYDIIKDRIKFPSYFPHIRWFTLADQKIYVLSYKKEGEKSQFYIFDIKGKFLNKIMVPFYEKDGFLFSPYAIKNGKLYQLIEDLDSEKWKLNIYSID